jgi:hypothetical protein
MSYQKAQQELREIGIALTFDSDMSQFRITRWNEIKDPKYFDDLEDAIKAGQEITRHEREAPKIRVSSWW